MKSDVLAAQKTLLESDYTCVLCCGDEQYVSTLRGVKPLIEFLESGRDFSAFSAADKVVGAGAAHLYVLLGVKELWAGVVSEAALEVLMCSGIKAEYEKLVPHIISRTGDGVCPIETAVKGIENSEKALTAIKRALARLSK